MASSPMRLASCPSRSLSLVYKVPKTYLVCKRLTPSVINAALRPLLATCRGQVDQAMLELFAYVHNHRRFVRGKRAGKAPIEILTGKELEKTWLDSLLETA